LATIDYTDYFCFKENKTLGSDFNDDIISFQVFGEGCICRLHAFFDTSFGGGFDKFQMSALDHTFMKVFGVGDGDAVEIA